MLCQVCKMTMHVVYEVKSMLRRSDGTQIFPIAARKRLKPANPRG